MLHILPLSETSRARTDCIGWAAAEWGAASGFTLSDWEAEFDRIAQDPVEEVFVALKDETPVGMAWLIERETPREVAHLSPFVSALVVDPAARGNGIGAALVRHVAAYARLGGDPAIHVLTEVPTLFFRLGWDVSDTVNVGGRAVFVMRQVL